MFQFLAPKLKGRPRKRAGKSSLVREKQQQIDSDSCEENKAEGTRTKMVRKSKLLASANLTMNCGNNKAIEAGDDESALHGRVNCPTSGPLSLRLAEKCLQNEQEFLKQLYKFMKERKTPIQRIPHLGFKKSKYFFHF